MFLVWRESTLQVACPKCQQTNGNLMLNIRLQKLWERWQLLNTSKKDMTLSWGKWTIHYQQVPSAVLYWPSSDTDVFCFQQNSCQASDSQGRGGDAVVNMIRFTELGKWLMLCTPVFIFTSGSSALLGHSCCGLSIWLSLLAIFNTLFWVYANFFHEKNRQNTKILSLTFSSDMKRSPMVIRRAKH